MKCVTMVRKSRRLQERAGLQKLTRGVIEPKHLLPSPSSSNRPSTEVRRVSRGLHILNLTRVKISGSPHSLLPPASLTKRTYESCRTRPELGAKRKRQHEPGHWTGQDLHEPIPKRARTQSPEESRRETERQTEKDDKNYPPIKYWAENGYWPKEFLERDPNMSDPLSKKRSRSTSYTQSVKDGDNPRAYTPKYEEVLAKAGISMNAHQRQATASNDCLRLCDDLLSSEYDPPDRSLFHGDLFWTVLDRVHARNESRVCRDVMPSIVPSAELLYLQGSDHLEHLTEELNAEWTKCSTLAGPQPKPDFCVGLMSSAFTEEEILKLKSYTAPSRATLVTENLYFPFLMCEVKCGEQALNRADRQNAHSASIAVNALVQLYRAVPQINDPHYEKQASSRVEELNRKILAFSISHDHSMVKIYGHYAIIDGDKETFYRHAIRNFDFTDLYGKERWTTYNFTRKVYDKFGPLHLKRIQSAIAQLPDPSSESLASDISINADPEGDSQGIAISAPSSQETPSFKRPALPPTLKLQIERR